MGNIWGVANPVPLPTIAGPSGNVTLPVLTETTILSSAAIIAPYPGAYYPIVYCQLFVLLGAAPPTSLTFGFKLGAGADVDTAVVNPALLVANATIAFYGTMVGANSPTAWIGAGSVINVTGLVGGAVATAQVAGSRCLFALARGPDV